MAIRVRRGNYADLDISKLVQGEPFVTLDETPTGGYFVGMTIAPNNVVRLATYDDLTDIKQDCEDARDEAVASASSAADSESNAEAWAVGERGGVPVTSGDDTYENNSKYYSDLARQYEEMAEAVVGIGIATTSTAGIVKPDGTSITIDLDGTLHSTGGTGTIDNAFAVVDVDGTELEADGEDKLTLTAGTGISLTPNASDNSVEISATGGGGGLLPHFYITSEAGSTVTVTTPDGSTITPTLVSAGNWECDVPSYGAYTVTSVYNGDTATFTVNVDDVKEYQIAANHFEYTIYVTAPSGSSIRVVDAGNTDVHTGTGTGSALAIAVHKKTTVYTITVTIDGVSKSDTVTTGSTSGGSSSVTIQFGTINLTLAVDFIGETITCVNGGTTISKTASSTSMVFSVPTTGTWVISGTVSGQTYSVNAVVSSLSTPVSATLETVPDGSTVLPTDDIQIWLNCAGIYDKTSYTTLADVLADHDTLQRLISNNNAIDYLVRSKTWIKGNALVPTLTADDGNTFSSTPYNVTTYPAWKAFDGDTSTSYISQAAQPTFVHIGYNFGSPKSVAKVKTYLRQDYPSEFTVQGSNDGFVSDINNLTDTIAVAASAGMVSASVDDSAQYASYRIYGRCTQTSSNYSFQVYELQFYTPAGITDDATAMRYIGKRNYASDTLIADTDWNNAIIASDYKTYIYNSDGGTTRTDVDETLIDIYSAASDTVYYLDNGSPVTVCTTDTLGHGSVSRASLPVGTYTLYSTVADNPSNLSADYSKSIDVHDYNIELYVMPDNALYWYGYIDPNCETANATNGWARTSYTTADPTYNTNSFTGSTGSSTITGIGSKNTIASASKISCIAKGTSKPSSWSAYCYIQLFNSKTMVFPSSDKVDVTATSKTKFDIDTITLSDFYIWFGGYGGQTFDGYALWYE